MNKKIANALINKKLYEFRTMGYIQLTELINQEPIVGELIDDGEVYQFEVNIFWDDKKRGNIRVIGSIDNGGFSAFSPLSSDFIITENNCFIGEQYKMDSK